MMMAEVVATPLSRTTMKLATELPGGMPAP